MIQKEPLIIRVSEYYRRFSFWFAVLGMLSIAFMMVSTVFDTIMRYLFNRPIEGIFELNEAMLVICVFMGVTWAQRDRVHVRVSLLVEKFPLRMIAVVDTMVWVVAFVFVMILAVQSWHYATYAFSTKMFRWGNVQMPVWWVIALVPIGLWLFCGQLIIDIWTNIYRLTGRIPMEIGEIKTK